MTIAEKLLAVHQFKQQLNQALETAGVSVIAGASLGDLATTISEASVGSGGSAASDPYWNYTALLLDGGESADHGANNNTIIDSSQLGHTITRNGNVAQGSFSPYYPEGYWSGYFDGNGDYLSSPSSDAFAFGTGDFTIECWININSNTSENSIIDFRPTSASFGAFYINNASNQTRVAYYDGSVTSSGNSVTLNAWNHIAYVRSNGVLYAYLNGGQQWSRVLTTNIISSATIEIGADYNGTLSFMKGCISDLRITKGVARYTANFTPSSEPLTADADTVLLCLQSNRFKDNSSYNHVLTQYGDTKVVNDSPYNTPSEYDPVVNGGSMYFDGVGTETLTSSSSSGYAFGTDDFTIEFFVNSNTSITSSLRGIVDTRTSVSSAGVMIRENNGGFLVYGGGSNKVVTTAGRIPNTWQHVAYTRSSGTGTLYVNGISQGSVVDSTNYTDTNCRISGFVDSQADTYLYSGYISNLRITKGVARYTSDFTPPTSPVTADPNTVLLLNGTNAGIFDAAGKNNIETVGDAKTVVTRSKYGTNSMYFDGTGDAIVLRKVPELMMGTSDFTWECWLYVTTTTPSYQAIIETRPSTSLSNGGLLLLSGSTLSFYAGSVHRNSFTSFPTNTWKHVVVTRNNGVCRLFVDGVQSGANATYTTNMDQSIYMLGRTVDNYPLNGYIDDLRITKGIARYTSNFIPPEAPLPIKG